MSKWNYIKIAVVLLLAVYSLFQVSNDGDFKVFREAATVLRGHETPYHLWFVHHNCLYLYSPFFAVLMIPFTYLPQVIPNLLWIIAIWFFTFRSIQLVKKYIPYYSEISWQKKALVIIPFLCLLRFWLYNVELLQMTMFILWCMLESVNLFGQKKFWWGGLILAMGINIKILPIVLVPYLILRGHWKALIPIAVFSVVFLAFPAFIFGYDFNIMLHQMWWAEINPGAGTQYAIESDLGPHSLNALIPSLLMDTNGDLPIKRNIADLSLPTVMIILRCVQVFFIGLTLYFTGIRFGKPKSPIHEGWELSYIFLVIPLIFPHQQKYAFFLALPAIMYITWFIITVLNQQFQLFSKRKWYAVVTLIIVSFILMTLTTDGLIGIDANKITQHFKLVTYGALALCLALFMCNPKYVSEGIQHS